MQARESLLFKRISGTLPAVFKVLCLVLPTSANFLQCAAMEPREKLPTFATSENVIEVCYDVKDRKGTFEGGIFKAP